MGSSQNPPLTHFSGGVDHMRGPDCSKWRGVPKEMHKHRWGKKFGKGKYRGGKGEDSDSDSDSDDEHHHHHHHHHHGMGMGRRHDRKVGHPHHDCHRYDWSDIDDELSFGPPFGRTSPPFGRLPPGGPRPGAQQGGHPTPYRAGIGKYRHSDHQFVDRVKDGFKHHKNGRPGKSLDPYGSGDDWQGGGHKFGSVSGPWDRYQAHRSWRGYNYDGDFAPFGGSLFEILKEFTRAPLSNPKGKPPHPPPHASAKTNSDVMNRPKPGGVPYGQLIKTCKDPGMVALTFDDGPFKYTTKLLDILKNNGGIRATFFVNGKNVGDLNDQAMKDTLKRIMADGHQIGSHIPLGFGFRTDVYSSFSHKPLSPLSEMDKISEMVKLENALHGIIGKKPTYMRPPSFECNDKCMKLVEGLGYHVIGENLDTQDWKSVGNMQVPKDIVNKAVDGANSKNSFIVLAHDIHEATVEQLAKHVIDKFKEKGYRFVTVGECLGDASENWYRNK